MRASPVAHKAASLIEMVVVVGILSLLIGLTLPAVQAVRESAARAACQNTMRQTTIALHDYTSAHGTLPPHPVAPLRPGVTVRGPAELLRTSAKTYATNKRHGPRC
jgi:type II secretory pathway pseudopilin PulG